MYQLLVFHTEDRVPRQTVNVENDDEAFDRIPEILAAHPSCARIVVMLNDQRLFEVDCAAPPGALTVQPPTDQPSTYPS